MANKLTSSILHVRFPSCHPTNSVKALTVTIIHLISLKCHINHAFPSWPPHHILSLNILSLFITTFNNVGHAIVCLCVHLFSPTMNGNMWCTWSVHKITRNVEKDLDQIFRVDRSQAWNKMIKCSVSLIQRKGCSATVNFLHTVHLVPFDLKWQHLHSNASRGEDGFLVVDQVPNQKGLGLLAQFFFWKPHMYECKFYLQLPNMVWQCPTD